MADKPELEVVLPDGRPVSEYQEPQEDMMAKTFTKT